MVNMGSEWWMVSVRILCNITGAFSSQEREKWWRNWVKWATGPGQKPIGLKGWRLSPLIQHNGSNKECNYLKHLKTHIHQYIIIHDTCRFPYHPYRYFNGWTIRSRLLPLQKHIRVFARRNVSHFQGGMQRPGEAKSQGPLGGSAGL
jgi:hypothetical protein